jgi:hypothetical protein
MMREAEQAINSGAQPPPEFLRVSNACAKCLG